MMKKREKMPKMRMRSPGYVAMHQVSFEAEDWDERVSTYEII